MRLEVLDQILVTGIRTDVLRKGDLIEVGEAQGVDLLKQHPRVFRAVTQAAGEEKPKATTGRVKASKPKGETK